MTRSTRLGVGDYTWHVAPRPGAEDETSLVGAAPVHGARAHNNQRCAARARIKLACSVSSPETVGADSPPRQVRFALDAGLAFEATAGTPHHGRTLIEPRLSSGQRPCLAPKRITASAVRRARADSSSGSPPPQRQRAPVRMRVLHTRPPAWHGSHSWHLAPRPRAEGETPLVGTAPYGRPYADRNQLGAAGVLGKLE